MNLFHKNIIEEHLLQSSSRILAKGLLCYILAIQLVHPLIKNFRLIISDEIAGSLHEYAW